MKDLRIAEKLPDFTRAKFTAILSDLHLCEEQILNPRYPLVKKYKTREFFFDTEFCEYLEKIQNMAKGEEIELVLNGDIFDFDSVMALPEDPPFRITWLERKRGLNPQEEKSAFKIRKILSDHPQWVEGLRAFIKKGHRAVFVIGNHDLELHFWAVQKEIINRLSDDEESRFRVRFVEWFYISNQDTLIEHGNQYDAYCVAEDPVNPFILKHGHIEIKVPFGNLATRFLINGMGFFNPHADSNYLMSLKEYILFFIRYIARAEPFLMFTWLFGSTITLYKSFRDRLRYPIKNPLAHEDKVELIAKKANATPRMVRELQELFVAPSASSPLTVMRELWLDRAFLVVLAFLAVFQLFIFVRAVYSISIFWMFIPLFLMLPFFVFYSRNVSSEVMQNKEPKDAILSMTSMITKVNRVVYGHTHVARHEIIGAVEHLNCGTWSPAFEDVECTRPIGKKNYVWIAPGKSGRREAQLLEMQSDKPKRP